MIEEHLRAALSDAAQELPSQTIVDYGIIRSAKRRVAFSATTLALSLVALVATASMAMTSIGNDRPDVSVAASPSPSPSPSPSAEQRNPESDAPTVARLVCDDGMRTLDPQVRPQRDGIHLEVDNRTDAGEFYLRRPDGPQNQGGKLKRMGTTAIKTTMAPGEIYIGCFKDNEDIAYEGGPEGFAVVTIVDPDHLWVTPELDCTVEDRPRIRGDRVRHGDKHRIEAVIRAVVSSVEPDDEIQRAGYPLTEWHGDFRMVVRAGEPVATVTLFQQRGRWHAFVDACEDNDIGRQ